MVSIGDLQRRTDAAESSLTSMGEELAAAKRELASVPDLRTDLAAQRPERVRVLHEQLMAYLRRVDAEVLRGYGKAKEEN